MSLIAFKFEFSEQIFDSFFRLAAEEKLFNVNSEISAKEWLFLLFQDRCMLFLYSSNPPKESDISDMLLRQTLLPPSMDFRCSSFVDHQAAELFLQIAIGIVDGRAERRVIEGLRQTYAQASEYGFVGPVFHRLFQRGIWLHEKSRMETEFFRFATDPASIFSELAGKIFGDLKAVTTQIIGYSEVLPKWVEELYKVGCRKFLFLGKDSQFAEIAKKYSGQLLSPNRNPLLPADADLLLFFTHEIRSLEGRSISRRMAHRQNAPLLLFDGAGRNCEKKKLRKIYNVFCYDHEDLQFIFEQNIAKQENERKKIDVWISQEVHAFYEWLASDSPYQFAGIVGTTREMQRLFELISRIAQTDITVLIQGESGTGKDLVASAIHQLSMRANKPFIVVNCGAIPENLLESELFGHVKGAFTGAIALKHGLFEEANHGTIFLDEIAELPPSLQVKLLRFLQEGEIKRVGSNDTLKLNVRVLAATNKDLSKWVDSGKFRSDLYYRLNVIQMNIPPLRNRMDDIPILAQHFMKKFARKLNKEINGISPKALQALQAYSWPGNVRELENAMEHALALTVSKSIEFHDLPTVLQNSQPKSGAANFGSGRLTLKEVEKNYIMETLEACGWNYELASKQLAIGRTTLWRKVREYNLTRE